MTNTGDEPTDPLYEWWLEEEALEAHYDALQDEAELAIINRALKQLNQERGAKTGAKLHANRESRAEACQAAADEIWAKNPDLSIKAVALQLERRDPEKYGSANTIKRMIRKPAKK